MSDPEQKPDHLKVTPAPLSEVPGAPKGKSPRPEKIIVVEDTQTGRAWTFLGTGVPRKHSPQ